MIDGCLIPVLLRCSGISRTQYSAFSMNMTLFSSSSAVACLLSAPKACRAIASRCSVLIRGRCRSPLELVLVSSFSFLHVRRHGL